MGQKMYADGVFGFDNTLGELQVAHVYPDWSEDEWWQAALTVEGKIANLDVTYTGAYLDRQVDSRLDYSDYSYFYDAFGYYSLYYHATPTATRRSGSTSGATTATRR